MPTTDVTADKVAITELIHRYQLYIDRHDAALWASTFTEDGVYETPFGVSQGTEQLIQAINQWHSSGATLSKRHMIGPIVIDVEGDSASASSYYWVAEIEAAPQVVATGTYTDRLRKVNGEWKIAHRKQTIDPSWKPDQQ
jgi:ketosteroid isomerase-like protein